MGASISSVEIASLLNNAKAPYNISTPTSILSRSALSPPGIETMKKLVQSILIERERLVPRILQIPGVGGIKGKLDSNFILVSLVDANGHPNNDIALTVYKELAEKEGVVVRYRGSEIGCAGCLRITVGTEQQNNVLLEKLSQILSFKIKN